MEFLKKKIGILTFHNAINYGAALQVFALQQSVRKYTDLAVEVINYHQPYLVSLKPKLPKVFLSKSFITNLLKFCWQTYLYMKPCSVVLRKKFFTFHNENLNLSQKIFLSANDIQGYGSYIVGSDQVWNTSITNGDRAFFLNFVADSAQKISYAASFGHANLSNLEKEYIAKYLPSFDYISVREDSAVQAIFNEISILASQTLDPTFLLTRNEWADAFVKKAPIKDEYLLLYGLEKNEVMYEYAAKISNTYGLKLVKVGAASLSHTKIKFDKSITDAGPVDFVNLFANASFVVTNSFHGTAFSIIFNKKFICIPHKTRGTRMISLLKMLGLENRSKDVFCNEDDTFDNHIDFVKVNLLIEEARETSLAFLMKSLSKT